MDDVISTRSSFDPDSKRSAAGIMSDEEPTLFRDHAFVPQVKRISFFQKIFISFLQPLVEAGAKR